MSTSERTLLAQIAAETSWANTPDRSARTAPARRALDQKFLDAADGDPARAEHLRRAYYKKLAHRSVVARRKARQNISIARSAEAELESQGGGLDGVA